MRLLDPTPNPVRTATGTRCFRRQYTARATSEQQIIRRSSRLTQALSSKEAASVCASCASASGFMVLARRELRPRPAKPLPTPTSPGALTHRRLAYLLHTRCLILAVRCPWHHSLPSTLHTPGHPSCRGVMHTTALLRVMALRIRNERGTGKYEIASRPFTLFSGAELFHTRPWHFYRTYSARSETDFSDNSRRAVGGWLHANEGTMLFPSTLLPLFSAVCIFQARKIVDFLLKMPVSFLKWP